MNRHVSALDKNPTRSAYQPKRTDLLPNLTQQQNYLVRAYPLPSTVVGTPGGSISSQQIPSKYVGSCLSCGQALQS